jgi:uncharacterized protein YqgC (DUF456 family)
MTQTVAAILAVLVMLVGLFGSILPILPGLPVIWVAYLGFGLFDGWRCYGPITMVVAGAAVGLSLVLDQLATMWGAQRLGAHKAGMIGSAVGGLAGLLILNLPGLILGAFIGAMACERYFHAQEMKGALTAGAGAILGLFCGGLAKFVIGSILVLAFILKVAMAG